MKRQGPAFGVAVDFYFLEMLTRYRTKVDLRTFRSVVVILYAFLVLILAVLALGAGLVTRSALTQRPGIAPTVLAVFLVVNLYAIGACLLREVFAERRFVVANSPNAPFYRAFDIRAWHVLVVFSGLRTTAFYVALLVVDSVFAAVVGSGLPAMLGLPVAGYALTLAVSAAVAVNPAVSRTVGLPWLVSGALGFFAIGYTTARFIAGPIVEHGLVNAFTGDQMSALTSRVAVAAPIAGCGALVVLGLCLRRLARTSFPIRPTGESLEASRRGRPVMLTVLHRELVRSKVYPLVRKNFLTLSAALLLCLGASAAGTGLLPVPGFAERFGRTAQGVAFVSFIVLVALVFTAVGPTTLAAQFRFGWENLLLSGPRIAFAAGAYYVLLPTLLAAGVSVLLLLVTGAFSVGPIALAVTVAAAAMIAETTVPPRENADGSSTQGTVTALIVLLLGVPTFAATSVSSVLFDCLAVAYSLCLFAGGVACMIRRIQSLPLRFAT